MIDFEFVPNHIYRISFSNYGGNQRLDIKHSGFTEKPKTYVLDERLYSVRVSKTEIGEIKRLGTSSVEGYILPRNAEDIKIAIEDLLKFQLDYLEKEINGLVKKRDELINFEGETR